MDPTAGLVWAVAIAAPLVLAAVLKPRLIGPRIWKVALGVAALVGGFLLSDLLLGPVPAFIGCFIALHTLGMAMNADPGPPKPGPEAEHLRSHLVLLVGLAYVIGPAMLIAWVSGQIVGDGAGSISSDAAILARAAAPLLWLAIGYATFWHLPLHRIPALREVRPRPQQNAGA